MTALGKIIAAFTMLCGVMVIALPTSIIGSNFVQEWQLHSRLKFQNQLHSSRDATNPVSMFQHRKSEQIRILRDQNEILLESIKEVQDRLAEVFLSST